MDIGIIQAHCAAGSVRWTQHVITRLFQRGIKTADIEQALMTGEIIEHYPKDYPYPSCLILGNALHVVCGVTETELWIITAYYPDPNQWTDDFKSRKRGS